MHVRRPGVSLLEIMISIGVVGIGLIGVASLIPLAHYKATEGVREDRKAIFGKRAYREFFIQGFDRPGSMVGFPQNPVKPYWVQLSPIDPYLAYRYPPGVPQFPTGYGDLKNQSYCLDPVWVAARNELSGVVSNQFPDEAPAEIQVPRMTVRQQNLARFYEWRYHQMLAQGALPPVAHNAASGETQAMFNNLRPLSLTQANEIFGLRDDIVVQTIENPLEGAYAPAAPLAGAPNASTQRQFLREGVGNSIIGTKQVTSGSFSWMATLTPEVAVNFSSPPATPYTSNVYQLSIVVFHQRDVSGRFREEVTAQVDPNNSLMLAGTKQIAIAELTPSAIVPENVGVRHIRQGDWIALMQNPLPTSVPPLPNYTRLRWYQVVAADELDHDLDIDRELTLSGPDWTVNWSMPVYAVYLRNVATVYEKTIELHP
jgi:hypothetical protein